MGLTINTNVGTLQAGRQASKANGLLSKALQQLSTARRINKAADDAAGLAIAEGFDARARQAQVEINNLQSGVNFAQTAEGGLGAQADAVQRIRELAVQAGNGTLTDDQRAALNAEAQELLGQIDSVAQNTQFNGQNVLNQDINVSLGTEGGDQINVNASNTDTLGLNGLDLSTQAGAAAALQQLDNAQQTIDTNRSSLGAQVNGFASAIEQRSISYVNTRESESRIRDLDIAKAAIEKSRADILSRGGIAALIQGRIPQQNALRLLGS